MKYESWISNLTIRERALMLTGKDFWHLNSIKHIGLPSIMVTDGPHGLRKIKKREGEFGSYTVNATCFPTASALACTWDRNLMKEIGNAIGEECLQEKVSVLLGPGVNIKRSPLCGRNFEYFSEDPLLTGELAAQLIKGVQENNVGTAIKHFAVNSTETHRMKCNAIVDERALQEIYLRAFEIAIKKAQPWMVMAAYNKINGTYCTENEYLLDETLRRGWGYEGAIISDWMAVDDRAKALNAGLDVEMPSSGYTNVYKIAKAYRENVVSPKTLDKSVNRVMEIIDKSEHNLMDETDFTYDKKAHHDLAKKAAEESIVLLKNDENILPLKSGSKVAVIGSLAKEPIYQGFGSSRVKTSNVENAYDNLLKSFPDLSFAKGYSIDANEPNNMLLEQAQSVAQTADVVVVFVGANDSDVCEGMDRVDMRLSKAQTAAIQAACNVNKNVVVVVSGGSCVEMPWHTKTKGIIQAYLLGESGGEAIANVLTGKVSPSGKLAETFPYSFEDTPAKNYYTPDSNDNLQYRESIFVGYRYYEKAKVPVMFPFGHGLSYTKFNYTDLEVSTRNFSEDVDKLYVYVTVENAGNYDSEEIVQLYVVKGNTKVFRPEKELKGFERVFLRAGEKKKIKIALNRNSFEYFSTWRGQWCVEEGIYSIYVGSSSEDIKMAIDINVLSSDGIPKENNYEQLTPSYFDANIKKATDEEFEELLFFNKLDLFNPKSDTNRFTKENTISDTIETPLGAKLDRAIYKALLYALEDNEVMHKVTYDTIVENIPLKRFPAITKGIISEEMVNAFVHLVNSGDKKQSFRIFNKGIIGTIKSVVPLVSEYFE